MMKKNTLLLLPLLAVLALPNLAQAQSAVFPDVAEKHPNQEAISYLKEENVVQGYPDGEFKADNRITRIEFAKILIGAIYSEEEIQKCTTSKYPDVLEGQWYTGYICLATEKGVVEGYPDGTFKPTEYINFVEAAKIVAEAEKIVGSDTEASGEWYAKYVKALEEKKAIPSTINFFDENITRGEMSEITYRIEANQTNKVTNTYQELSQKLPTISSCDALEEKMTNYFNRPYYYGDVIEEEFMMDMAVPAAAFEGGGGMGMGSKNLGAADYSETNVQVEGVDEGDIVKNDGKYIYMIKEDTVRIVEAYPPADMKEVAKIDLNENSEERSFYPQELYVMDDRLVVVGQQYTYFYDTPADAKMIAPIYNNDQTKIVVFDIEDRENPKKLREVAFDGLYFTSRRIDDHVYLVLNSHPHHWNWKEGISGEDFLPTFKDGTKAAEPMVGCTDIRYFPGYDVPQYLITAAIDIDDVNSPIERDVMLGNSGNVYASATDLFVVGTYNDYNYFTDWDWTRDETKSHVYRFGLDEGNINFMARGEVSGRSLDQFSMDQHDGNFRIATTTGDVWNWEGQNNSKNNVYVLDSGMNQIGKLEGLAPGEQIYSTRFIGDRLYMVTFEQVDPFFVIDLANPRAPKVLGELKIPGFSEYLHPYDENHLIGFGQETKMEEDEYTGEEFVTIAGFKMSLFDVTDVKNPKEKDKVVIGDSGTYSDVLYNHKALLFDKKKNLLAFPLQVQELVQPYELKCSEYTQSTCPYNCIQACVSVDGKCADVAGSCVAPNYEQYQSTFNGAMVYNVDPEEGFTEKGRISHMDENMTQEEYWEKYYYGSVQRILYMGEYLYTVALNSVKASNLDDLKEVDMVELEMGEDYAVAVEETLMGG